jgi:hypothetical protein
MLLSVVHVLFKLVDNTTCVVGMYVLVVGPYIAGESKENHPAIKVPSLSLTLSSFPVFLRALFIYW